MRYTFASSGITVEYQSVSQRLLREFQIQYRHKHAPKPPVQIIVIDGKEIAEPNLAHPDFEQAMQGFEIEMAQAVNKFVIKRAVKSESIDRALLADALEGVDNPEDERIAYVYYVAALDEEEIWSFASAIINRSQASEEGIAAQAESFPNETQGAQHLENAHA